MLHVRLKELRTNNEMTQTELGKRVGVIKQTVSSWENNTSTPNYEIVCKLAEIFNVSTDYLLGASNSKETKKAPLTDEKGSLIVQRALKDTGLLDQDGKLSEEGGKVISDFITSNADILKKLIDKDV